MIAHLGSAPQELRVGGVPVPLLLSAGSLLYAIHHKIDLSGCLLTRQVTTSSDVWFEVGVPVLASTPLAGNASAGWTCLNDFFRLEVWWSENLSSWSLGSFASSGEPEARVIEGVDCLVYWARSIYSIRSNVRTGNLWCASGVGEDVRNAPFTALTLNNVVQNFGGPYTMPADAGALQAKLRLLGFSSATVSASSATVWRIDIPAVEFTLAGSKNKIYWPAYAVTDPVFGFALSVDGRDFSGTYVNASGVRCHLDKQFVRVGCTLLKL